LQRWNSYYGVIKLALLLTYDFLLVIISFFGKSRNQHKVSTDVLFIMVPGTSYLFQDLWANLRTNRISFEVLEIQHNKFSLQVPRNLLGTGIFGFYALRERDQVAEVARYSMKYVCSNYHMGIVPSLVKKITSAPSIFLPHSVIDGTFRYSNFDYDVYCLFGESSIISLKQYAGLRMGFVKSKIIGDWRLGESSRIYGKKELHPNRVGFFVNPEISDGGFHEDTFNLFLSTVSDSDFIFEIRVHPLMTIDVVNNKVMSYLGRVPKNLIISDSRKSIINYLTNIFVVVHSYSNASLEAAKLGIPSILLYPCDLESVNNEFVINDYLSLRKFFPKYCLTSTSLNERIFEYIGGLVEDSVIEDFYSFNVHVNGRENLIKLLSGPISNTEIND